MRMKLFAPCIALAVLGATPSASAFTEPGPPDAFDAPFRIDSGVLTGGAALGSDGTAYLAYKQGAAGGATVARLCVLPLGHHACSSIATLTGPGDIFGAPQVFVVGPQEIHVVVQSCCNVGVNDGNGTVGQMVSTDGGRTFGPYAPLGSLGNLSQATRVGANVAWVSGTNVGGTSVQSAPLGGATYSATSALVSADTQDSAIVALPDSSVLVANDDFNTGPTITHVELAHPGADLNSAASWSLATTLPNEGLIGVVSGPRGAFLITIANQPGVLDPPVRVRHWNGATFDAPTVLPVPGGGDDSRYAFVEDGTGRLHAFWIGARESSRTWHSISGDGGHTWHARLLGAAAALGGSSDVNIGALDANGAGVLLETPAAGQYEVVQPVVVSQAVTLTTRHATITRPARPSFTGKVSPARPGTVVTLQVKNGSAWKAVGRGVERADGSFRITVAGPSTRTYRAFVNGVFGRYDQGASARVTVRVRART